MFHVEHWSQRTQQMFYVEHLLLGWACPSVSPLDTAMICSGKSCVEEEVESPAPTPLESEDFAELMWAYLDCFSGVSGNMFLGALLDAGVPAEVFEDAIASMGLENVEVRSSVVRKHGIAGQYVEVVYPKQRVRRHLQEITDIIQGAGLDPAVSSKAVKVFRRLAEAEAKAHGTAMDKIHFHEVGAVDTIVDVVCTVAGFHHLGVVEIHASPVQLGTGFIKFTRGTMPVPAPATVNLLKGVPSYSTGIEAELTTPTGAALLTSLASAYGPLPAGRIVEVGYGAGVRELPIPNLLRLILFEPMGNDESIRPREEVELRSSTDL